MRNGGLRCGMMCALLLASAAHAGDWLAKDGQSAYRIVLQEGASPSEQHAAEVLRDHFKQCTGVELAIGNGAPEAGQAMILLGCGPLAKQLGVDPAPEQLGEQGYVLRTLGKDVVIAGTHAAGTLYGAYDFLETVLGVRWYAPGITRTPAAKEVALPALDKLVKPAFRYRNTSYCWAGADADFRSRMHDNSGGGLEDCPYGVQFTFDGSCHSYFRFISPGEFFDTHPEYFSEIGGVRRGGETQLCLTNPDVLEIVTERMLKRMADQPNDRQHNFSQMDCYSYCQCPRCNEINAKYGTRGGTQYWFLNQLAERTAKVYPNKLINTLAYMYTEEPPKDLVMHPNVAVWLCHMYPSCDSHPIATCPLNADYKRRAEAWAKITSHLYVWHYIVDFAHYFNPFPNLRAMAADMRFYRDIGVEGIYLQGNGSNGGEFYLLRPYYGMKLLWNPDEDPEAIQKDFLEGYYGAAAGPIQEYLRLLHDKVANDNIHMHLYTNPAQGYLTDEVMQEAKACFDRAEAAVKEDAELLERVRVARMPLGYAGMFPRNGYVIEPGRLTFQGEIAPMSDVIDFVGRMRRHDFPTLREASGDPNQMMLMDLLFTMPMALEKIGNAAMTVQVAPMLGGRALQIVDNASGQCVTATNVTRCLFFPFQGGEENRIGSFFDTGQTGFFDQYQVVEKSPVRLVIQANSGGWQIRRELALLEERPVLRTTVTVTNTGKKPREAILRSHTEMDLGELTKTGVHVIDRTGAAVDRPMPAIIAGLREGEHYLDERAPKGSWTLTGTKGLQVTQRFEDAALDYAWLYAYPDYLNDLEVELWAKPVSVAPGASASFTHELEIGPAAKP